MALIDDRKYEGLPVPGYKPQSQENVNLVTQFKEDEERLLRKIESLQLMGTVDPRWLSIGATHLEQAFMAINRSILKPTRVKLPGDTDAKA